MSIVFGTKDAVMLETVQVCSEVSLANESANGATGRWSDCRDQNWYWRSENASASASTSRHSLLPVSPSAIYLFAAIHLSN